MGRKSGSRGLRSEIPAKRANRNVNPMTEISSRVLVVDDQEAVREIISAILTAAGYQCRTAADGLEALGVLDSEKFDLMITNFLMPNLDGFGLLERAKKKFPSMPVVVESAAQDVAIAGEFLRRGAFDYLVAPFEREQLLAIVHRAMAG
jgi:DNA-binding NtrC family response regulator